MWPALGLAASLCLLSVAGAWLCYQWSNRRILRLARRRPTGLPTLPLIGHIHQISFNTEVVFIMLLKLDKYNNSMGDTVAKLDNLWVHKVSMFTSNFLRLFMLPGQPVTCAWLGPLPYFVIHRCKDFQSYFRAAKTTEKTGEYELFKFIFGDGLVTAPVDTWKKTRRHLNPMFRTTNVAHLISCFNESARTMTADLGRGRIDVHKPIASIAAKNVLKLLLGCEHEVEKFAEKANTLLDVIDTMSVLLTKRFLYPWLWFDQIFNLIYKSYILKVDYTYNMIGGEAINKIIKAFERDKIDTSDTKKIDTSIHLNGPSGNDATKSLTVAEALSTLRLEDPKFVEHPYLRGEAITLTGVGTETVSATMSACLLALGTHPNVQEALYEEVKRINENDSDDISIDNLNNMPYLDQVIKETMRRFWIVPIVTRIADKDIQMEDTVIPAGASVILSMASLHMDPSSFPNPDGFDPENFSPENVAKRDKYSFLPFFSGARDSIGKHYAMYQMKITIAQIVRRYHIYSDVDITKIQYKYGLSLTSSNGYWMELKQRQSNLLDDSKDCI